jgi:hypothetical protein
MSIITSPMLLGADTGGAYQVSRSLRFNAPDSSFLSRTPASAGNRKTWTWAGWVKLTEASGGSPGTMLFGTFDATGSDGHLLLLQNNSLFLKFAFAGNYTINSATSAVFRDYSAWYHVVVAFDTTQATQANRLKIYVNGTQQALVDVTWALNTDYSINSTTAHAIGRAGLLNGYYFPGYLADIHFIDGQALTPSSFTKTDATTGQLIPKAFSGSYGSQGWKLSFSDNSTTAALGTDTSGNGNTWTTNNFSVTAGSGNDSLVDTPTSYGTDTGVGGTVRGNYCTLNPLNNSATLSNGNLQSDAPTAIWYSTVGTIYVSSGKWYWEVTPAALGLSMIGVANKNINTASNASSHDTTNSYTYYNFSGNKFGPTSNNTGYGATYAANDVIGVALDLDNGTLVFYKNNTSQGTAYSGLTGIELAPFVAIHDYVSTGTLNVNFGQRAFSYQAPTNFKALVDTNLPTPVVAKPNTVMDVKLYTGNGSTQSITGLAFNPDLVWIKSRNNAYDHKLTDALRGATQGLISNTTGVETTDTNGLTAFNSDGFSLGTDTNYNGNAATYVAWAWDAGSSTAANTAGSISSQVRANASAGFSVVTYTGTGTNATVGHGLGVSPSIIFLKSRGGARNWVVYSSSLTSAAFYLSLNQTSAQASLNTVWNSTAPTSTVFNIGTDLAVNNSSETYVAYCFAPVAGYGNGLSYVGNGSADGPFVYLGFRPKLILIKCSSTTGNWVSLDAEREGYNVDNDPLFPNLSDAEGTTDLLDITSNGFKIRSTNANVNASAATYIYAAFAESPFQYARAR